MNKRKLQVFVSSTFTDLVGERQAAVAAILKSGHIPAGMELFNAGDKSQLDTIKRWIDESDAYMLILGGRYGSIEPVSNVSYTELEYDYAAQQNKPLFAVVIKEEALELKLKLHGSSVIEKEHPKALELFRKKVLENISSFFSDEKDIRLCVHESLADMRDNPAIKGWVSANDIEDTKHLNDEIRRLKAEVERLEKIVALTPKAPSTASGINSQTVAELVNILEKTPVEVPANLSKTGPKTSTLFSIFVANKDILINGVTNSGTASALEIFFYSNVMPKLIVHRLAENEKVAGVRFRRSFINSRGVAILAEIEKISAKPTVKQIDDKIDTIETRPFAASQTSKPPSAKASTKSK